MRKKMYKMICLFVALLLVVPFVYATATRESGARDAMPVSIYGTSGSGEVTKLNFNSPTAQTDSQLLSSDALDFTTTFGTETIVKGIFFRAGSAITQTVEVLFNSSDGSSYDTVLVSEDLSAEQNLAYVPTGIFLREGDEITVTCTNSVTPSITVFVTVMGLES